MLRTMRECVSIALAWQLNMCINTPKSMKRTKALNHQTHRLPTRRAQMPSDAFPRVKQRTGFETKGFNSRWVVNGPIQLTQCLDVQWLPTGKRQQTPYFLESLEHCPSLHCCFNHQIVTRDDAGREIGGNSPPGCALSSRKHGPHITHSVSVLFSEGPGHVGRGPQRPPRHSPTNKRQWKVSLLQVFVKQITANLK